VTSLDAADLGTILSLWAHPDDEGYCCGALMARAVENGQRVLCVTATRGELGSTDESRWPNGPRLAAVRTAELAASLAVLGVTEHVWLDYPDGGCAEVDQAEAIARVKSIIDELQPDTILTFGPDGATFHPDHIAVSGWASAASSGTSIRVLHTTNTPEWMALMDELVPRELVMMADGEPDVTPRELCTVYLALDGAELDRKNRAMLCMESQIGPMLALGGVDTFSRILGEEAFVLAQPLT
jgi:LmbE family N-acetylglucosaminyl deacetylase